MGMVAGDRPAFHTRHLLCREIGMHVSCAFVSAPGTWLSIARTVGHEVGMNVYVCYVPGRAEVRLWRMNCTF
jgi:hypothetical protein